jgi:hypothetical protein
MARFIGASKGIEAVVTDELPFVQVRQDRVKLRRYWPGVMPVL